MSILNATKSRLLVQVPPELTGKNGTPYLRCPCCGKLSRLSNFTNKHRFPDGKIQFNRGGKGHGFFWVQMTDQTYLTKVKGMLREALLALVQRLGPEDNESEIEWEKSKSAWIQAVPSSSLWTTGNVYHSQKINATPSRFLKISQSSLKE